MVQQIPRCSTVAGEAGRCMVCRAAGLAGQPLEVRRTDYVDGGFEGEQDRPEKEQPIRSGGRAGEEEERAPDDEAHCGAEVDESADDLIAPIQRDVRGAEVRKGADREASCPLLPTTLRGGSE
jgi:hypothetical protein